jgi:septum formation topological specificity factor MinE
MIEREFDSLARIKSGVRGFEGQHSPEMKSPMEVQASAALRGVGSGLNMTDRVETIEEHLHRLAKERLEWALHLERAERRCRNAYTNLRDGIFDFIGKWSEKGNGHTWVELINDLERHLVRLCPDVKNLRTVHDEFGALLWVDESVFPVQENREHR